MRRWPIWRSSHAPDFMQGMLHTFFQEPSLIRFGNSFNFGFGLGYDENEDDDDDCDAKVDC